MREIFRAVEMIRLGVWGNNRRQIAEAKKEQKKEGKVQMERGISDLWKYHIQHTHIFNCVGFASSI